MNIVRNAMNAYNNTFCIIGVFFIITPVHYNGLHSNDSNIENIKHNNYCTDIISIVSFIITIYNNNNNYYM